MWQYETDKFYFRYQITSRSRIDAVHKITYSRYLVEYMVYSGRGTKWWAWCQEISNINNFQGETKYPFRCHYLRFCFTQIMLTLLTASWCLVGIIRAQPISSQFRIIWTSFQLNIISIISTLLNSISTLPLSQHDLKFISAWSEHHLKMIWKIF